MEIDLNFGDFVNLKLKIVELKVKIELMYLICHCLILKSKNDFEISIEK